MLIASMLLKEERDVYLPIADDHGIDILVVTKNFVHSPQPTTPGNFSFQELQVKMLSTGTNFTRLNLSNPRPNYWFVFYLQHKNSLWLINSMDLKKIAVQIQTGRNKGTYHIDFKNQSFNSVDLTQFQINDFNILP